MLRGLYSSGSGMQSSLLQMDVISNNMANVNTTAFKEKMNVFKSYPEADLVRTDDQEIQTPMGTVDPRPDIGSMAMGVSSDGTYINFRQGSLKQTGNPLDVALEGEGFFEIQMPDGETAFSRDGSFKLNSDSEVVTSMGRRLLDTNGNPIQIPGNTEKITITPNGNVFDQDNQQIAQINIVQFENKQRLEEMGENMFRQGEDNPRIENPENVKLRQGVVETTNFSPVKQMTRMIEASRKYEMNSQILQQQNSTLGQAITTVGRN